MTPIISQTPASSCNPVPHEIRQQIIDEVIEAMCSDPLSPSVFSKEQWFRYQETRNIVEHLDHLKAMDEWRKEETDRKRAEQRAEVPLGTKEVG